MSGRKRNPRYAVGRLLDQYVENSGRTIDEIADAAGISRTNIYNWIGGAQANAIGIALLEFELGIPHEVMYAALIAEHAERLRDASAVLPNPAVDPAGLSERLEQEEHQGGEAPRRHQRGDGRE